MKKFLRERGLGLAMILLALVMGVIQYHFAAKASRLRANTQRMKAAGAELEAYIACRKTGAECVFPQAAYAEATLASEEAVRLRGER